MKKYLLAAAMLSGLVASSYAAPSPPGTFNTLFATTPVLTPATNSGLWDQLDEFNPDSPGDPIVTPYVFSHGWTANSNMTVYITDFLSESDEYDVYIDNIFAGSLTHPLTWENDPSCTPNIDANCNNEGNPSIAYFNGNFAAGNFALNAGQTLYIVDTRVPDSQPGGMGTEGQPAIDATVAVIGVGTVLPEPVSIALMGTGLVGLGLIRRRRR